ncbi:MAG: dockerin type I repeat-containing protein [Clostridia bacterium]|nr:dockerin type I repeat-containing protein [Clostridia bacterium]
MKKAYIFIISLILILSLPVSASAESYVRVPDNWEKLFVSDPSTDFRTTGVYEENKIETRYCELGDPDNDWRITAADARLALRQSVGLDDQLTDVQIKAMDADRDGNITAADARLILRAAIGLEQITNDGVITDRKSPPTMKITEADIEELTYIGCEYIRWLGIPVDPIESTGYDCEVAGFFRDWSYLYEPGRAYANSVMTPKEILKLKMLDSIYHTYKEIIEETGDTPWSLYPVFTLNRNGPNPVRGDEWIYWTGYSISYVPYPLAVKNGPYDYPYTSINKIK